MAIGDKPKTKTYIWRGRDKTGQIRKNEVVAINEALVRTYLNKQGIIPISVIEKPKSLFETKGRITPKHIVGFSRQMATMLKAGMSVTQSLSLISEGISKPIRLREMIQNIQSQVESGNSLSVALSHYPVQFNDLYIALLAAGEESGTLDDAMDKVATSLEKSEAIKKKVKKSLTYPAIVIAVAIIVTIILLVKVIPVFEGFFANFGADLPLLTQMVIAVSKELRDWGWMIPVALIVLMIGFFWFKKRNRSFQRKVNRLAFRLPVLGGILKLAALARFSRTLSVLFESGVPLVKGLRTTAAATGSVVYEEALHTIANDVENGAQLNFSMQSSEKFDSFAVQMVAAGEESGNLGEMLDNVANVYEDELDYKIDNITTLIEPMVIAFLALIVGVLVIAMYMPIFMLGDIVG